MTPKTRTIVNTTVPAAATLAAFLFVITKSKDWRYWVAVPLVVLAISYIVTTQLTKVEATAGPAAIPVGAGCDNFDPSALTGNVYSDLSCFLCSVNYTVYDQLIAATDCQLQSCWNYWNTNYFPKMGKTLPAAISGAGSLFFGISDSRFAAQQASLAARFSTLSLQ